MHRCWLGTVFRNLQNFCSFPYCLRICFTVKEICWLAALVYSVSPKLSCRLQFMFHSTVGDFSFSSCEETAVSESSSSIFKYETSPPKEDISSSPLTDWAGDASGVAVQIPLEGDGDDSTSSTAFCRLQYIMLAARVRIIFWFTCHQVTVAMIKLKDLVSSCK